MSLDHDAGFGKLQKVTHDAFLGGRLTLCQPETGFRAGLDSVLLAASVARDSRSILDLGAGVGAAGLCALADIGNATATLVELDPDMAALAKRNAQDNELSGRCSVIQCDVVAAGAEREAKGIARDHFDSVIANPPFFEADAGTRAPDDKRANARHMPIETLDAWVRTAAASAAPKGEIIFINRVEALPQMLAAFSARLGGLTILPVQPRPGSPVTRVLVRGRKGSRAPLTMLSPLVLHGAEGHAFVPPVSDVLKGRGRLDW